MKKKLACILILAMTVSCLMTGCKNKPADTETGNSSSSETESEDLVDVTEIYKTGEYEGVDMSKLLTLGDTTGLITLKAEDYTVTKEELQDSIDEYRESYGDEKEVKDRPVQKDDIVNIDYVGRVSGIKFDGGSATGYDLTIGSHSFIDDFEEQLIGAKIGETVVVEVTFPTDYRDTDLAGKDAEFTVTVNSITEIVPAEYNDELVKEITDEFYSTTAEFDKFLETQLLLEKKSAIVDDFLTELVKKCTFTDEALKLVNTTYDNAVKYYEQYAAMYSMTLDVFATQMGFKDKQALLDVIKIDATETVHSNLALYAYGNSIMVDMSDAIVLERATSLSKDMGYDTVEEFLTDYGVENVRSEIYREVIADKLIEANK